nr:FISUMP domain-containing protein [Fibrobacter succinogenes]
MVDERDGKIYKTVVIGSQTWMAENLNYADSVQTPSLKESSWCRNDDADECSIFGRLYTWIAAIDSISLANDANDPQNCGYGVVCDRLKDDALALAPVQGVCPNGWHLPSLAEWETLFESVGGCESDFWSVTQNESEDYHGRYAYYVFMTCYADYAFLQGSDCVKSNAMSFAASRISQYSSLIKNVCQNLRVIVV